MDATQQQIVESIKATSNILVTVSTNPSVDELSAALGLTLLLDKMDKRVTSVFSGNIPPAITFLDPQKTFEGSPDSLRDFIVALDKEKADHLRYKVDGDVVKIFITPYKTTLSEKDLEFSQGDYNVELVIALGVSDQDHLDKALDAHGKILHDAKVVTITSGDKGSKLGSVDWHGKDVSSLSEMIVGLADQLKETDPLLDEQVSTALLTGIVSATDRFSNDRTSSHTMTMAAQLMAAGANQQLIAAKLEEAHDIAPSKNPDSDNPPADTNTQSEGGDGTELVIEREGDEGASQPKEKVIEPLPDQPPKPETSTEDADQIELEKQLAGLSTPAADSGATLADMEKELQQVANGQAETGGATADPVPEGTPPPALPTVDPATPTAPDPAAVPAPDVQPDVAPAGPPPTIINDHGPMTSMPQGDASPINSIQTESDEQTMVDPFNMPAAPQGDAPTGTEGTPEGANMLATAPPPTGPHVVQPLSQPPVEPPAEPAAPTPPPAITPAQAIDPEMPELPPLPPLPPMPNDANMPPLPPPPPPPPVFGNGGGAMPSGAVSGDVFGDSNTTPPPPAPTNEPGQFKIPGQ